MFDGGENLLNINDLLSNLNQPDIFYENEPLDKHVHETVKKCSEEGKMTSMIKLELKTKIQLQKLKKGENINVEWRKKSDFRVRIFSFFFFGVFLN